MTVIRNKTKKSNMKHSVNNSMYQSAESVKISASQRYSILLVEAREDMSLRRELMSSIKKSNEVFSNSMAASDSII